jgi:hypothetical protein
MDVRSKQFLSFIGNPAFFMLALIGLLIGASLMWLAYVELQARASMYRMVYVDGTAVHVTIADSPQEREQGLSGRAQLPPDEGLLFVFGEPGIYSFWMKDMLFSIDILWFSEERELIHIEEKVRPDSYPTQYAPEADSLYVLEVPAGFVEEYEINIGDQLTF